MAAVWGHSDRVLALILAEKAQWVDESTQKISLAPSYAVYQQTHHSSYWHNLPVTGVQTFPGMVRIRYCYNIYWDFFAMD